jgi:hypothetical protein
MVGIDVASCTSRRTFAAARFAAHEADGVANESIDVDRLDDGRAFANQRPESLDHLRGQGGVTLDVREHLPDLVAIRQPVREPTAGRGVVPHGRERLGDLVGNRSQELARERQAGGVCERALHPAQRVFSETVLGDVTTGIEHCSALDGHALQVDEHGAVLASLRRHLALDVADLAFGGELGAVEDVRAEKTIDRRHRLHFVRHIAEDDVDVRTDPGERPLIVGEKDGVRDAAERRAMQFFRLAERFIRPLSAAVTWSGHGDLLL